MDSDGNALWYAVYMCIQLNQNNIRWSLSSISSFLCLRNFYSSGYENNLTEFFLLFVSMGLFQPDFSEKSPFASRSLLLILEKCESEVKFAQSCATLCDPMDYRVHRILQSRILERVAFPFSRGSSQPRDWTQVSHIAGRFFTSWATREAQEYWSR